MRRSRFGLLRLRRWKGSIVGLIPRWRACADSRRGHILCRPPTRVDACGGVLVYAGPRLSTLSTQPVSVRAVGRCLHGSHNPFPSATTITCEPLPTFVCPPSSLPFWQGQNCCRTMRRSNPTSCVSTWLKKVRQMCSQVPSSDHALGGLQQIPN